MIRAVWILLIVLSALGGLAGCSQEEPQTSAPNPAAMTPADTIGPVRKPLLGAEIYAGSCASCHDNGIGGAPAIGDKQAWSQRSRLWTAVLEEHAKRGYMDMPEKGGNAALTDAEVAAAAEYILSVTYPELPSSD